MSDGPGLPVQLADVEAAAERVSALVHRTPLLTSSRLAAATSCDLVLKAELLQKTGSFKVRGALNKVTASPDVTASGVITISAGNHAQSLAWAAARRQVPCTVVMPVSADPGKVAAARGYGAEVVLHGDVSEAFAHALQLGQQRGLTFVHPFDDPLIVAGAGTVGLELAEQVPDAELVVCPIGGGGLISGVAVALRALRPGTRIVGVEPEGAAAMRRSLDAGSAVTLPGVDTIADGLAPPMAGVLNHAVVSRLVDDVVLVSDAQIFAAMAALQESTKLLAEPAGAAAIAALMAGVVPRATEGGQTVALVTGGNIGLSRLCALQQTFAGAG